MIMFVKRIKGDEADDSFAMRVVLRFLKIAAVRDYSEKEYLVTL